MPTDASCWSGRCCWPSSSPSRRGCRRRATSWRPILIVVFGFFFVTVSSRITGLIGTSSNPISGMTIATLILTCLIFVALGWTGDAYGPIALCVGAVVCIAAANAGGTSQDLKTGYLVGATPIYQQIGLVIGVVTSALVIGMTTLYLHQRVRHRLGGAAGAAGDADGDDHQGAAQPEPAVGPGARRRLHLGHARAVRHPLAVVRGRLVPADRDDGADLRRRPGPRRSSSGRPACRQESEVGAGTLFSSGLIAGGSLCGILYAVLVGHGTRSAYRKRSATSLPFLHDGASGYVASALLFLALASSWRGRRRRR